MSDVIVLIPTRLPAQRLPNKPLADIHGKPMIVHVWQRAVAADLGPVVVACADAPIAAAITDAGGNAVLTDPALPSGTDRITAALHQIDPDKRFRKVINVQGDLPTLNPHLLIDALRPLDELGADIGTLVCATEDPAERDNPNVVKAIVSWQPDAAGLGRCLYFTRASAPSGSGPVWHHIGLYAYTRAALEAMAAWPPSPLEQRERLEQLRALEHGLIIGASLVDTVPLGVDTPEDLDKARARLAPSP